MLFRSGRSEVDYTYTPGGAIAAGVATAAGNRQPDITIIQNIFDASLVVPFSRQVALRVLYRYESGSIRDWHYQNIEGTPVVLSAGGAGALPTAVVLDGGPQDFHASVFGVLFQIKM